MDDVQKNGEIAAPTAEELKHEDEVLQETPQEQVRSSIIEKYGLDEESNADLIDRLTEDQLEQRKALGKAIKQKRDWRSKATTPANPSSAEPAKPATPTPQQPKQPDIDALVDEKFEKRDLESLDVPDELRPEIRKLAKLQGITVRQAANDPYILHRKQEIETAKRSEDAAVSRTGKGTKVQFDPENPPKVDMSTEEGRKRWADYRKFMESRQ